MSDKSTEIVMVKFEDGKYGIRKTTRYSESSLYEFRSKNILDNYWWGTPEYVILHSHMRKWWAKIILKKVLKEEANRIQDIGTPV